MSAKSVMTRVKYNDSTMANDILPTKRGTGARQSKSIGAGAGANQRNQPTTEEQRLAMRSSSRRNHDTGDLLGYDHNCGIHGAARERRGIKRGTSAARRRWEKELIESEVDIMNDGEE